MWSELAKNLGIVGIILAAGLLWFLLPYLLVWASELLFKFAEWQRKIAKRLIAKGEEIERSLAEEKERDRKERQTND